jgi:hypothetical protein
VIHLAPLSGATRLLVEIKTTSASLTACKTQLTQRRRKATTLVSIAYKYDKTNKSIGKAVYELSKTILGIFIAI